jgi:hypothetical protein
MSFDTLYAWLSNISALAVLAPLIAILFRMKRLDNRYLALLLFSYLAISLVVEIIDTIVVELGQSNQLVDCIFAISEFLLINQIFVAIKLLRKPDIVLIRFFQITGLALFFTGLFNKNFLLFEGLSGCTIVYLCLRALFYLINSLDTDSASNILESPVFLLIAAILIFFGSNFFVLLFDSLPGISLRSAKISWTILLITNMVYYFFLYRSICRMRIKL